MVVAKDEPAAVPANQSRARSKRPADLLPEDRDHLAMVGPGGDHQAHRPGVKPPEHDPRQEKALAHRPPGRHDGDRAPRNRPANLDLLGPEPAAEDLLLK